jgi:hypothetical protein
MKLYIGYFSDTRTQKFVIKATTSSREKADKINKELSDKLNKFEFNQDRRFAPPNAKPQTDLRYKILSETQYQKYLTEKKSKSLEKRRKTLANKSPEQKKKTFILCPQCNTTSKLLYSEMGGLQTRRCKNGHQFKYDKWIGDRLLSVAIFGAGPLAVADFVRKNPTKTV